jgi:phytoene dehydrogenase-like protein
MLTAPIVISGVAPDLTVNGLVDGNAVPADIRERFSRVDHRGSYLQMHFALDGIPEFASPYELLNDPAMQSNIGIFSTPEELQQQWEDCRRGIVPAARRSRCRCRPSTIRTWRRPASTPHLRSRCGSRSRTGLGRAGEGLARSSP